MEALPTQAPPGGGVEVEVGVEVDGMGGGGRRGR